MSLVIGTSYPLRLMDLMQEHRLKLWVSSMSSLLLVSTVVVYAICAVTNIVVPDQTEDAGAGGLFFIVYLEATPSLTGD